MSRCGFRSAIRSSKACRYWLLGSTRNTFTQCSRIAATSLFISVCAPMPTARSASPFRSLNAAIIRRPREACSRSDMVSLANRDYAFASWLIPFSPTIQPTVHKIVPPCFVLLPSACRLPLVAARHLPTLDRPAHRAPPKARPPLVPSYLRCWQIPAPPGKKVSVLLRSLPPLLH